MDQQSGQNGKRRQMEAFAIDDAVDKRVRERIERVLLPQHVGCKMGWVALWSSGMILA